MQYSRLSLLLATSFSTVMFAASSQADILIGVAGPMSGSYANYGEQVWRGASAAADAINLAGGVNGEKIKLIKGDDACEPKQAVAVANKFVDSDKVVAVVGHFCSSSTIPASDIYADANILTITPGATNPTVTERGLPTLFRNCGRDDQQASVAANYITDVLKGKRVVVLHDKDTYGQGLADATRVQLRKNGIEPVLYEGLTRGEKDFSSIVTKIRSLNADTVYFGGLHPEAGPLVRQMREQGVTAKFVSDDGVMTDEMISAAGGKQYVDGVLMTFGSDPRLNPAGKPVVEKFRAAGFEPEGFTMYSYTAVQAIAAAFNATHGTDTTKAAAWLKSHPVTTALGVREWDSRGDLTQSDYVMYQWSADGTYKQL